MSVTSLFLKPYGQGQTPGKRFVKIRVICDDGKPVRLQQSTLRSLLRPVDDFFFLGVFFIVLGKREKTIRRYGGGNSCDSRRTSCCSSSFPVSQEAETLATQLLMTLIFPVCYPKTLL
jgi:hypothetical protein